MLDALRDFKQPLAERRALTFGVGAGAAAVGFAALNFATVHRHTAGADRRLGKGARVRRGKPARRAAKLMAPIGKWYTYLPFALALSAVVLAAPREAPKATKRRGGPAIRSRRLLGAAAIVAAGGIATALNPAFDRWLPQPPVPPGRRRKKKAVYPSGHAFGPGAVALTAAWVMGEEGIAPPAVTVPLALLTPLLTAGPRLVEEKHWASDVVGGYLGAAMLAATCLGAYETARR